jgi:hypothetical protein
MRLNIFVFACMVLAACQESTDAAPAISSATMEWRELADGSMAGSRRADHDTPRRAWAARCWAEESGWNCLIVSEADAYEKSALRAVRAARILAEDFREAEAAPDPDLRDGYYCARLHAGHDDLLSEGVEDKSKPGKAVTLVSHVVRGPLTGGEAPWTADYVRTFIADKKLDAEFLWLPCAPIQDLIRKAGIEAIHTPALTRAMMD